MISGQAIRDLEWVLNSPFLMRDPPLFVEHFNLEHRQFLIRRLQQHPESLLEFLAQKKRHTLGEYAENLVRFLIMQDPNKLILAHNLQVFQAKKTLGEFDLIFEEDSQFFQYEIALKYYLGDGDLLNPAHWYGPAGNDRLDLKLQKMLIHQINLHLLPEGQALLKDLGVDYLQPRIFMKGFLFYPWPMYESGIFTSPLGSDPTHSKGWWMRQNEWDESWRERLLVRLQKPHWLAPFLGTEIEKFDVPTAQELPVLVAEVILDDGVYREVSRGFIVSSSWPTSE